MLLLTVINEPVSSCMHISVQQRNTQKADRQSHSLTDDQKQNEKRKSKIELNYTEKLECWVKNQDQMERSWLGNAAG